MADKKSVAYGHQGLRARAHGVDPIKAAEETLVALTSDTHEIQEEVRRIIVNVFT